MTFRSVAVWRYFCRDDAGSTAIEYGLIICLIVLGIMAAVVQFGHYTANSLNGVATSFNSTP